MKFIEYVEKLNKFLEQHPNTKDYNVVYSVDEEGNSYNFLYNGPRIGFYDEVELNFDSDCEPDSVCIN